MLKHLGIRKQLFTALIAEAQVLEELQRHPHSNPIPYHGCRVMRGHITGLMFNRNPHDLQTHIKHRYAKINKALFLWLCLNLQSSTCMGLAGHIMISFQPISWLGMPVLIDCAPVPIPHFLTTAHIPEPVDETTPHMTSRK